MAAGTIAAIALCQETISSMSSRNQPDSAATISPIVKQTAETVLGGAQGEAGKALARPLRGPSPLDDIFALLSARKV